MAIVTPSALTEARAGDNVGKATTISHPGRYYFLDGLRGVAAMTIVVHHFTALSGRREVFASAYISVDFFFCLSGFVIALAYHDRLLGGMSLVDYARRRMIRLYPMYLIGMAMGLAAISVLAATNHTDLHLHDIVPAAIVNAFYLPYFNDEYIRVFEARIVGAIFPLNNPAWSLFFGVLANFLYALSLRADQRLPLIVAAGAAAGLFLAAAAFGVAPGWSSHNFAGGFPRVLFAFFAGVLIYQHRDRLAWVPRVNPAILVGLVLALALMPHVKGNPAYWLACALVVMPLIVAVSAGEHIEPGSLAQKLCSYSGRISYPLFCVHYPLLMVLSLAPSRHVSFPLLLALFLFCTLAAAHLLMKYVEEPARAWLTAAARRA